MRLSDIRLGDVVRLKLPHWKAPLAARAERFGAQHCQLHGEFIGNTITFRKIKSSGRESYLFDVLLTDAVDLLETPTPGDGLALPTLDASPKRCISPNPKAKP